MREAASFNPVCRPSQIRFKRPAQMEIFAKIVCFPPLGSLTIIARERPEVEFTVVLEVSRSLPPVAWEVSIWHNCPTKEGSDATVWQDLPLTQSAARPFGPASALTSNVYRHTFTATVRIHPDSDVRTIANFTIKYRAAPNRGWQWVKDQFGMSDGSLVIARGDKDRLKPSWASHIFGGRYLEQWNITPLSSQAPGAVLFKVESKDLIPRNGVDDAQYESKIFGSSHVGYCRYMALVRVWTPWLAPRHGEHRFHITEDALFCSFLTHEGQHAVLLPVNGVNDTVTVLRSDNEGHIIVAARNDGKAESRFKFLAAIADDFEVANAAVMYEARKIVDETRSSNEQASLDSAHIKTESNDSDISHRDSPGSLQPRTQWLDEWCDGLTYCTWNSLGQALSAEKLMEALDDLATHNIHISGLIIDDNWQSLDGTQGETSQFHRGWTSFEANKEGFPDGLKATVTRIKNQHPAISNVGVWHGLLGYWGGLSPSGTIAKNYKTIKVEKPPEFGGGHFLAVHPSDIHRMYDDFYTFLSSCGITSVKTDNQFYLDLLVSTPDRRALTTVYQAAWTIAHLRHLSGKAISCMSQVPQILFHSLLPVNTPRILLRNSDDFFPSVPASHPWHVFCNAHNALLVQHLNVLPDWDMFQTSHPYSYFHAAARCVSGGPIYVTDAPGEHDLDLIAQMTAENVRGQTVILRPSVVGKTVGIYDPYHDGRILRVGTYNGAAQTGTGMLGLFNVSDHEISSMVPITDFPGVRTGATSEEKPTTQFSGRFIIHSHVTGRISNLIVPTSSPLPSELTLVTLPIRGYDILTAHPVHDFRLATQQQPSASTTSIAILGLLGKMTGACAITSTNFEATGTSRLRVYVSLKGLGTLGIWISNMGLRSIDDDFLITILGQVVPREKVTKRTLASEGDSGDEDDAERDAGLLEIDVLGAWKDMKLDSGWSNEVTVDVLIQGGDRLA